jgi:dCMP deaminase
MDHKKWDRRFMDLASLYATWSKDPSRQVGAVITREKKQVSQGYNGFPPGVKDIDERLEDRQFKLKLMVHAERNAIYNARENLEGSTMYTTLYPCNECAKSIASSGIKTLIFKDKLVSSPGVEYNEDITRLILAEAGVQVIQHEKD